MTTDTEIDVEELRAELDQIKDAMGLTERYRDAPRTWLLYGLLVAVSAAASQLVVLEDLSSWWHPVIWVVGIGGGSLLGGYLLGWHRPAGASDGKPSPLIVFLVTYLLVVPIQLVFAPVWGDPGTRQSTAIVLGLIVVLVGAAYLLMGNLLRAYYIRRRDRLALYVGGLVLVPLGVAIPNVELLHTWGFAAFGAVFAGYAGVASLVLTRGGERP